MGFTPSLADPDIWMRDAGDCYEYVCSYVDDLTVIMHDPKAFFDNLSKRGFGLKGSLKTPMFSSVEVLGVTLTVHYGGAPNDILQDATTLMNELWVRRPFQGDSQCLRNHNRSWKRVANLTTKGIPSTNP
jgi:hypothetical protein